MRYQFSKGVQSLIAKNELLAGAKLLEQDMLTAGPPKIPGIQGLNIYHKREYNVDIETKGKTETKLMAVIMEWRGGVPILLHMRLACETPPLRFRKTRTDN